MTLIWAGVEIFCDFNTSVINHQIIISSWGWYRFLATYFAKTNKEFIEEAELYKESNTVLKKIGKAGILLVKQQGEFKELHVNEVWYDCYKNDVEFKFDSNKKQF